MRIAQLAKSVFDWQKIRRELADLLDPDAGRPPVCSPDCQKFNEIECNRYCPEASVMLSSEPDYPLEPNITPLVFELKRLGAFQPCWSCEGHNDKDGKLWKIPRVWFYADSMVHVRVLADAIAELYVTEKLLSRWEIALTMSDPDNADTSFSLQPNINEGELKLTDLQKDVDTIATLLRATVFEKGGKLSRMVQGKAGDENRTQTAADGNFKPLFSHLRAGRG